MQISGFRADQDLERLEAYLRNRYFEDRRAVSWLPERLHDLIYRVGAQELDEGRPRSSDFIYLWEERVAPVACLLPDGENIYVSVKPGYEEIFPSMVSFSERNCLPLFSRQDKASVKFWFAVSDSLPYMGRTLEELGYRKYAVEEYTNCISLSTADFPEEVPDGFRFLPGEAFPDEGQKWSALRLGFHPEWESPDYRAEMNPYRARKRSSLYPDSFECVIVRENASLGNRVCAYCFVYVDSSTGTAMIEPVSTREPFRHRGLGTALIHGAVRQCKNLGLEKCYVISFGERKDFYTAAGFSTEDSVGFWYKTLPGEP